jgi:hypothetical protein
MSEEDTKPNVGLEHTSPAEHKQRPGQIQRARHSFGTGLRSTLFALALAHSAPEIHQDQAQAQSSQPPQGTEAGQQINQQLNRPTVESALPTAAALEVLQVLNQSPSEFFHSVARNGENILQTQERPRQFGSWINPDSFPLQVESTNIQTPSVRTQPLLSNDNNRAINIVVTTNGNHASIPDLESARISLEIPQPDPENPKAAAYNLSEALIKLSLEQRAMWGYGKYLQTLYPALQYLDSNDRPLSPDRHSRTSAALYIDEVRNANSGITRQIDNLSLFLVALNMTSEDYNLPNMNRYIEARNYLFDYRNEPGREELTRFIEDWQNYLKDNPNDPVAPYGTLEIMNSGNLLRLLNGYNRTPNNRERNVSVIADLTNTQKAQQVIGQRMQLDLN